MSSGSILVLEAPSWFYVFLVSLRSFWTEFMHAYSFIYMYCSLNFLFCSDLENIYSSRDRLLVKNNSVTKFFLFLHVTAKYFQRWSLIFRNAVIRSCWSPPEQRPKLSDCIQRISRVFHPSRRTSALPQNRDLGVVLVWRRTNQLWCIPDSKFITWAQRSVPFFYTPTLPSASLF